LKKITILDTAEARQRTEWLNKRRRTSYITSSSAQPH
jgi:hypothetical protein